MAYAHDSARFDTGIARRIETLMTALRQFRARRAAFNQTYTELSLLSQRELDDLGIARSDIAQIARDAAARI